ncbi:MAG: D-alanine--D-alanine ligase [Clostridiales bacterium]|jgi:D-alanine-D-alanine ligase|nr:D-alanine--D-alanine ligase [Clostridiales bacterium]
MKKNILVIFGGKSCEHDISVITALQALKNADREKYDIFPLYIKDGMYTGKALEDLKTYADFDGAKKALKKAEFVNGGIRFFKCPSFKKYVKADCALICCHGGVGENGQLQGLLEFYGIPYTSAGTAAAAVFMDKTLTKEFAYANKLPILPYYVIKDGKAEMPNDLEYPLIVKPASLGSSIGISVAHNADELKSACDIAAQFDSKIIVEKALSDFTEINCAAVRDGGDIIVSECERPVSWKEFLSFDEKYGGGGDGMKGQRREYPAKIPNNIKKAVQNFTRAVYSHMDMKGSVRIDFLIDKTDGFVYLNEINTVPGSLAYYLFTENGITFKKLIGIMIETGISESKKDSEKSFEYKSRVLNTPCSGVKK